MILFTSLISRPPPPTQPSLRNGLGRPVALFCRSASFFSLCSLLRARMRLVKLYPNAKFPLFFIDPLTGACCIHEAIQLQLYKNLSCFVNPFRSRHLLEDCMLSLDLDVKKEVRWSKERRTLGVTTNNTSSARCTHARAHSSQWRSARPLRGATGSATTMSPPFSFQR